MSNCANQTPSCGSSYTTQLTDCNNLTLTTGLADGSYWFTIIDKFGAGHTYQYTVTGGDITLNMDNYGGAFFNSYSGYYEIFAHTIENIFTRLDLTIDGSTYTSILFDLTVNCCSDVPYVPPTPPSDDVTLTINSASFDTVECQTEYDVVVKDTNGNAVGSKVGTEWIVPADSTNLTTKFYFQSGDDVSPIITIDASTAGTYTAIADDGGSGTITLDINGGGFGAFVNPTVLVATDTLQIKRTTTTSDGDVTLTGTY